MTLSEVLAIRGCGSSCCIYDRRLASQGEPRHSRRPLVCRTIRKCRAGIAQRVCRPQQVATPHQIGRRRPYIGRAGPVLQGLGREVEIQTVEQRVGGTKGPCRITRTELFLAFLSMGTSGFGGVLPWARRVLVERRAWMTPADFNELLSLGQILPGPNIVNLAVVFGVRCHGVTGGLLALTGLILMPLAIVFGLILLYDAFGELTLVQNAFRGISPAAAGLVVAMAIQMAQSGFDRWSAAIIAGLVLVGMTVLQLPLAWVIFSAVPLSILWTWAAGR
jgi:chromate transporter